MRLGVSARTDNHNKTFPFLHTRCECHKPERHEYAPDEQRVVFNVRPWTRTAQGAVEKRAKLKGISSMDADEALRRVGSGDKKAEAFLREMADYLIFSWENVIFSEDAEIPCGYADPRKKNPECQLCDEGYVAEDGVHPFHTEDEMPCLSMFKVFLFEDVQIAVDVVEFGRSKATVQFGDERKNVERSSDGMAVVESLPTTASA